MATGGPLIEQLNNELPGPGNYAHSLASAIGTIIDIAVKLVKPKSFLTPTSGLVRNAG